MRNLPEAPPLAISSGLMVARWDYRRRSRRASVLGAVHLADSGFYRALKRDCLDFDVVLCEGVQSEKEETPLARLITALQREVARKLGLALQVEEIVPVPGSGNLVRCDVTAEELSAALGGDEASLIEKLEEARRGFASIPDDAVEDAKMQLARVFVEKMGKLEGLLGGKAIIERRNEVAFEGLRLAVGQGMNAAALYGAAHLPGLDALLHRDGWKRVNEDWRVAWKWGE